MPPVTLVTMFFDLKTREDKDRRDWQWYAEKSADVLMMKNPMVIFTEPRFCTDLLETRRMAGYPTRVIPLEWEQLPYYDQLEHIREARRVHPLKNGNPNKDTPEYTMLCWCKSAFMSQIAKSSPFNTPYLAWIDLGISHVATNPPTVMTVEHPELSLLCLRLPRPHERVHENSFYDYERGIVAAGFWTGARHRVRMFHENFEQYRQAALRDQYAPSEQQIYARMLFGRNLEPKPGYRVRYGDYCDILRNYATYTTAQHFINYHMEHPNRPLIREVLVTMCKEGTREVREEVMEAVKEKRDRSEYAWFVDHFGLYDRM